MAEKSILLLISLILKYAPLELQHSIHLTYCLSK